MSHGLFNNRNFSPGEKLLDRYLIIDFLGRGGMGEVYSAYDLLPGVRVALKFLAEPHERDRQSRGRLLNEIRHAWPIAHPNVCQIYDAGELPDHLFLKMEYIAGATLQQLLRQIQRLTIEKAIELGVQIASGLAAAHRLGILHRDLKPANVMVDLDGQARITDFGLAESVGDARSEGLSGGTPAYMAPELLAGSQATPQSDLYSLGLLLYEMLTGRPVVPRLRRKSPVAPRPWMPGLDPTVARMVSRCLASEPGDRPASAMEVETILVESQAASWQALARFVGCQ